MHIVQPEIDFSKAVFNGPDYVPGFDDARLRGQIRDIYLLMRDGLWRTLGEIEQALGYPQASISAQLRHLRKERFGLNRVEKRRRGDAERGLFEYRLLMKKDLI